MTALNAYERLETVGLYFDGSTPDGVEVVIELGKVSLIMSTPSGVHVAHWALPAVELAHPQPGILQVFPSQGATTSVVLDDSTMVDALNTVHTTLRKRAQRPWVAKYVTIATAIFACLVFIGFVLPVWIVNYASSVPAPLHKQEISLNIMATLAPTAGPICETPTGWGAMAHLSGRLFGDVGPKLYVMKNQPQPVLALPGNILVLSGQFLQQVDDPSVIAGHIIVARADAQINPPFRMLVAHRGVGTALAILTTGDLRKADIPAMAQWVSQTPLAPTLDVETILQAFDQAGVSTAPYAASLPPSQFQTDLRGGNPYPDGSPELVLSDGQWLGLQDICGG